MKWSASRHINVLKHNNELREKIFGTSTFKTTWNMFYEGLSSVKRLSKMKSVFGNRSEWLLLTLLVPAVLILNQADRRTKMESELPWKFKQSLLNICQGFSCRMLREVLLLHLAGLVYMRPTCKLMKIT